MRLFSKNHSEVSKLNPNRYSLLLIEFLVYKSFEYASLPYASITNDHNLEEDVMGDLGHG